MPERKRVTLPAKKGLCALLAKRQKRGFIGFRGWSSGLWVCGFKGFEGMNPQSGLEPLDQGADAGAFECTA